jgi:hypothetical protein
MKKESKYWKTWIKTIQQETKIDILIEQNDSSLATVSFTVYSWKK